MRHGLTIPEILVVLSVIGSLAAAVTVGIGQSDASKTEAVEIHLAELTQYVEEFIDDTGRRPRHLGELIDTNLITTDDTKDPWGRTFSYQPLMDEGEDFVICSRGVDGHLKTSDDICGEAD